MIRRPPRSTLDRSSAASDVYKRQLSIDQIYVKTEVLRVVLTINEIRKNLSHSDFQSLQYSQTENMEMEIRNVLKKTMTSVSYTHLRAHETVLDLVCRLLLEKKKKTTPHTQLCYDAIHRQA